MKRLLATVLVLFVPFLVHAEEHPPSHAQESRPPQIAVTAGGGVITDDHLVYESTTVTAGVSGSFLVAPRLKIKVEGGPGVVIGHEPSPAAYLQAGPAYVFGKSH